MRERDIEVFEQRNNERNGEEGGMLCTLYNATMIACNEVSLG